MERYYILSTKYSLYERKKKDGKKVYDMVFRVITMDGKEKQKWMRGFSSKKKAEDAHLAFITEYCEVVKENPLKKKDPAKDALLVGELARQYLATLGNQNKQSVIYDKNNTYRLYVFPLLEKTPANKLTKEALYQWQDWLWGLKNPRTGAYFSHKYLMKIRSLFSALLVWTEQRYGIKNNLVDVAKPKNRTQRKEMAFWTREQFAKFIKVVDDETYKTLFTFMFFTGRRKGEIFALYKTDVRPKEISFTKSVNRKTYGLETWQITSTKADKTCTVPVCKAVQEVIKSYNPPKDGKFYFGGKEPLPPATVDRAFKRYTQKAGLPQIRIHDLRHSFVSMLIHLGASIFCTAELISDSPDQITKTYGHLYQSDKERIISQL